MFILKRVTSNNADFQELVHELDSALARINGEDNDFFAKYNKIDALNHVVVLYVNEVAVGCGALNPYSTNVMEVKRMFIRPTHRGKGLSKKILQYLLSWAKELGKDKCILETGEQMTEAIGLYKSFEFQIIPNYGQYADIESSICFEKVL